jgi:hypothetical protein
MGSLTRRKQLPSRKKAPSKKMRYVSFEWRRTLSGELFFTKAAEHSSKKDAARFANTQNLQNTNPKRGYAWSPMASAPSLKV